MSDKTEFGERMKFYESFETERRLCPLLPVIARMDGICFSKFTRGLKRPFCKQLSSLMVEITERLLNHFGADAAYTQSDEITLGWKNNSYEEEIFCGGRVQKLNSHLASKTTVYFNKLLSDFIPEKSTLEPCFDARVFSVPNLTEAANCFLWREQDAAKNSISMLAQSKFSHKQLQNKNGVEMLEMLKTIYGIDWSDYPNFFKRGTFLVKRKISVPFTQEELESLPPKHAARKNPELIVERNKVIRFNELPKFSSVTNREGFLFLGEEPKVRND